jgi:hypothetical protein
MRVTVQHNGADVDRFVQHVFADQIPFVTAMAINDAAKAAQVAQRAHQERVFTVRRKQFVERAVKIKPFATKQSPEAKIQIDPPGGAKRRSVLVRHESDRQRIPFSAGMLAVPTDNVPRTAGGVIPKQWRPRQLLANGIDHGRSGMVTRGGITRFRRKSSGGRVIRGRRAAFLLRNEMTGRGTIFERDGDELVPLYHLVPSVPLDQRLDFAENVTRVVNETYAAAFTKRFDRAIRTAR